MEHQHQRCSSGDHVYDASKHSSCPFCDPSGKKNGSTPPPRRSKAKAGVTTVIIGGKESPSSLTTPAVGWLVIVKGKGQGRDLKITPGMNVIGRDKGEIRLPFGDTGISREKHAFIAYDPDDNFFMINHGEGKNPLKVNRKMVMSSQGLLPYDRIKLGKTELLFVPLCGDAFNWGDGYTGSPVSDTPTAKFNEVSPDEPPEDKKQQSPKVDDDIGLFFK